MTATWNTIFFTPEVEFDHLSPGEREAAGARSESQSRSSIAAFVDSVSGAIVGTFAAVMFTAGAPDITQARIVREALGDEIAVVQEASSGEAAAVPDDVPAPAPQDLARLGRLLRLGRPADGLDHLL